MEPVSIILQAPNGRGVRLSIPAAYMHYRDNRLGGLQNTIIALLLVYPEMTPLALESATDQDKLRDWKFPEGELRFASLIHLNMAVPQSVDLLKGGINSKYTTAAGMEGEFVRYRKKVATRYYDYLVPPNDNGVSRVAECAGMSEPELQTASQLFKCSIHVQLSDRLQIDYGVPRSKLSYWRAVDEKVVALISSFIVDCFEGELLSPGEAPPATHECRLNTK